MGLRERDLKRKAHYLASQKGWDQLYQDASDEWKAAMDECTNRQERRLFIDVHKKAIWLRKRSWA